MFEAADWLVMVGSVSLADNSGKSYRALKVFYHPQFNTNNNDYDVGLLRTITDIDMTGGKELTEWRNALYSSSLALKESMQY